MEVAVGLLEREKSDFTSAWNELHCELEDTTALLYTYYQEASEQLESGKYIVNTSITKCICNPDRKSVV